MRITAEATWIGAGAAALSGWVVRPTDESCGVVILLPTHWREGLISNRTMHALAIRLAEAGFVTVRIDWRGSAGSAPGDPDHPVETWLEDITTAVEYVRSWCGGLPLHLVGLRLGATLLANWPGEVSGDRLLWEPVSGRQFVRGAVKLRQLTCEVPSVPESEGIEVPGALLTHQAADDLGRLRVPKGGLPPRTTVRKEEDRKVADLIYAAHPQFAQIPEAQIREIVAQFRRDSMRRVPAVPLNPSTEFQVEGRTVVETFVSVGPEALHGVLTVPPGPVTGSVVFTAAGSETLDGPSGVWVPLSREVAARGVMGLRIERRQLGVHTLPDQLGQPSAYTEEAVEDTAVAVDAITEASGHAPVGVGVCVGAWLMMRAAARRPLASVLSFDNLIWHTDIRVPARMERPKLAQRFFGGPDRVPIEQAVVEGPPPRQRLKKVLKGARDAITDNVPPALRSAVARHLLVEYPDRLVDEMPRATPLALHFGEVGETRFQKLGGKAALARWRRVGRPVTHHYWHDLDHSALGETSRRRIRSMLLAHLERKV